MCNRDTARWKNSDSDSQGIRLKLKTSWAQHIYIPSPVKKLFELVQSFNTGMLLHNDSDTEAEASSVIVLLMLDPA
jgi:hypothetical protein